MTITENVLRHQADVMISNRLTYLDIIRLKRLRLLATGRNSRL